MRFPWSMTHGMLLLFLRNVTFTYDFDDTWHAIKFPILFRDLIFAYYDMPVYFLCAIQKFEIYIEIYLVSDTWHAVNFPW